MSIRCGPYHSVPCSTVDLRGVVLYSPRKSKDVTSSFVPHGLEHDVRISSTEGVERGLSWTNRSESLDLPVGRLAKVVGRKIRCPV